MLYHRAGEEIMLRVRSCWPMIERSSRKGADDFESEMRAVMKTLSFDE